MPKVDRMLLNAATYKAIGGMEFFGAEYREKWVQARKMAGITKGQWKRFQHLLKRAGDDGEIGGLVASTVSIKKLEIMSRYHDSPHLVTHLKMAEARGYPDEGK